jgi:hypothetical protein
MTKAAWRWVCGTGGKIMTVGERITWRVTCPYATLPTTNLTWSGPGSKSRLCGEIQSIPVTPHIVVHGNARLTPTPVPSTFAKHGVNQERQICELRTNGTFSIFHGLLRGRPKEQPTNKFHYLKIQLQRNTLQTENIGYTPTGLNQCAHCRC